MKGFGGRAAAPSISVPGEFLKSHETTFTTQDGLVRLSAFKATHDGLFVTLTALGMGVVVDPRVGFSAENNQEDLGVWLLEGERVVASEIQRGSVMHPEAPDDPTISTFELWFPLPVDEMQEGDLGLCVALPGNGGKVQSIALALGDIREAAANALAWPHD